MPSLRYTHNRVVAKAKIAIKTTIKFTIEIQETGKKALEGLATFIYYFKS